MPKDSFLKPVSFLFIISAIVAVISFTYNIAMSRMLAVPDFGDLRAVFSILMIFGVPVTTLQTMMAKYTAEYAPANLGRLKSISLHILKLMLVFGFIIFVIFTALRYPITNYLRISSANLVVIAGLLISLSPIAPIVLGIYQGLQRFIALGVYALSSTILNLLMGLAFVYLGWATLGALSGLLLSGFLVILIFGLMLIWLFSKNATAQEAYNKQDIYSYSGYALGVLICFSIISQIDILIVKHKFLPADAGLYACAAVIGKGFLILPVPVVTVLFPKVVANNKAGKSSLPILIQALFITLLLCIIGIIVCFFFPHYLVKIFGAKYLQALDLFKIFGLAMSPLVLFYVLMMYFLSEYRKRFFYYCLLTCIIAVAILFSLPQTLNQFLHTLGWYSLIIFLVPLIYILAKEGKVACRFK